MVQLTTAEDLRHVRELAVFVAALVLLIACFNLLHGSDTLAYLMAVGILCSRDEWRSR
ncbi:hypothetical protein ACIBCH_09795 [Amycolatopsis thailandensis]|uniref:hypothetical protein n=1 Tax=Amycolatopsis thailandensis TaxID=589330 RepID=UPI00378B2149